jgi:ATP-dependent Lon protease
MSDLDQKLCQVFAGKVVRKDLVKKTKVGINIPVFVLEYLLGKYCATDDPIAIEAGIKVVKDTIANNFVRPEEANKAQTLVKDRGKHTFIDKVQVRYLAEDDKHWAELKNFGNKFIHFPEHLLRKYDRLLTGGIWAQVEIRHQYDEEQKGKRSPFWIDDVKPIQLATFNFEEYCACRQEFTTEEWIDILLRTIGLEPDSFELRVKLLLLIRLIPLCEQNFNLIELGPRGTGKSYAYQELTPYCILLTGPTTVANLFYNMATNKVGLVGIWDAVAFDEVADLQKMPKEVVTTLKTYCESGSFARGKDSISGRASIAMFGNTNQPVETMVRSSHLFIPLPDVIREDIAFLDRIHYYIPGWEIPKMRMEFFTDRYGLVIDYLAEALRELRQRSFTELVDEYFAFGSHLNARDAKAVRKSLSGLIKLLYPHGQVTKAEMEQLLEICLEGRRRVKEQLKKMASFEYHQTSFSFIDQQTREERFVGVPEQGGRDAIAIDPLPPGSVYTAAMDAQGKVGLYRIEVGSSAGSGQLKMAGGVEAMMKESFQRAFNYLKGQKIKLGIGEQLDNLDFYVEAIDLLNNHVRCEAGIALIVSITSAIKKHSALAGLIIIGDLTITGNIKGVSSLSEILQMAMENGAKRALIPIENKRLFLEVSGDIMEKVDPIFYADPITASLKALGING